MEEKMKKMVFLLSLFLLFSITISAISANDINTTIENYDNSILINNENILSDSDSNSLTQLQSELRNVGEGETITLSSNYAYENGDPTGGIGISKAITIDGNGYTIDGKNSARIFYISANGVTLKNINFVNANGGGQSGGAVFIRGESCTIDNCNFASNIVSYYGGAVYGDAAKTTIKNSNFTSNSASASGGAVYFTDKATSSIFSNNKIINNNAQTNGAGIAWLSNAGTVTNNEFTNNKASSGSAIFWVSNNGKITGNKFTNNTATATGAALLIRGDKTTLDNNKFTSNTATDIGGAIYWDAAQGTITNNEFVKSTSTTKSGGAIYLSEQGTNTVISNNIFSDNTAKTTGAGIGSAGPSGRIINNKFSNNWAGESGSALYCSGTKTTIKNNTFTGNKVDKSGGAIYIETDGIIFDSNILDDNSCPASGGAIRWNGNNGTLTNSVFTNNKATQGGGALFWNGDDAIISNNNFTNNIAQNSAGGAILYDGNNYQINSNKFIENNALAGYGGAIYSEGANNNLNENEFTKNSAKIGGGAIYFGGTIGTATNNKFIENSASNAGAIRWNGDSATVTGNTFKGNTVTSGNIIYGDGEKALVTKNTFLNNKESDNCIRWNSDDAIISGNIYMDDRETKLSGSDLTMYYGGVSKLVFTLTTTTLQAIPGKKVSISFDNSEITATTNAQGQVSMDIKDLQLGNYTATAKFAGDGDYDASTTSSKVTVKSTIISKDLTAEYGSAKFNATFFDSTGKALAKGESVSFTIDNDAQRVQVGDNGVATITVKKAPGDYTVNILNTKTGETVTNKLKITKASANLKVTAKDIAEGENAVFDITSTVQNAQVTLTINGANYPATLEKGKTKITVSNLTVGKYPYTVKFAGNDNYTAQSVSGTLNVKSDTLVITAPDLSKYFGGSERFVVKVSDKTGAAVSGITITILINGVQNNRTVENGEASIGINLMPGNYTVLTTFKGNADYNPVNATSTVTVKTTNIGKDVSKIEKGPEQYVASFTDGTGKKLTSGTAIFNINGVFYYRDIDSSGQAKLNLRLGVGQYVLTAYNPVTNEQSSNIVKINSRFANNSDVTKYYRNDTQYHITLLGDDGKAVGAGEKVTFNINGVFYERTTDENGTASLNINLMTGDYVITAIYKECMISNKIKVLSIIKAQDIVMSYRDGTQFKATLLDGQGKPFPGQNITLNINGVLYPRVTDNDGMAALTINLMPGQYIITSYYETFATSNKITIR